MEHLEATVEYYLKNKTDYAILINGPWGAGKTHYFKKHIIPLISETQLPIKPTEKFKPILVSLYGLKSTKDVQSQIFYELYPVLNKKAVRYGFKILGAVARNFIGKDDEVFEKAFGDLINNSSEAVSGGDMIKYTSLVICLDDLERRGKDFSLDELFGLVNSWTQDLGVKVILIANENESKEKFVEKKEKVIGVTIEFSPELKNQVLEIINDRYSTNELKSYKLYLQSKTDFIVEFLEGKTSNLRTIVFALDYFSTIYSGIVSKFREEEEIIEEVTLYALRFTLAVSIEYRDGRITSKSIEQLQESRLIDINIKNFAFNNRRDSAKIDNKEVSYIEEFQSKYFRDSKYMFIKSIFNFTTTANYKYVESGLISELYEKFGLIKEVDTPDHTHVYNVLLNNANSLSDSDYKIYVRKLLLYLEEGKYEYLSMYYSGYNLIVRFNNLLNYDKGKIVKRIIKGVKKAKIEQYMHSYELEFPDQDVNNPTPLTDLVSAIIDANKEVKERDIQREGKMILSSFENDTFSVFSKLIRSKTYSWRYGYLKFIPIRKVIKALKTKNVAFISEFNNFIKYRYEDYSAQQFEEHEYLRELLAELTKIKTTKRRKIAILWVAETIKRCLPPTIVE